jgi:hypothetical protein
VLIDEATQEEVLDPAVVARRYLRSWFTIDLFSRLGIR